MKKIFKSSLLLLIISFATTSCQKDNDLEPTQASNSEGLLMKNESFINPQEHIGIQHNEGLTYIFQNLNERPQSDELIGSVESLLSDFYSAPVSLNSLPSFPENVNDLDINDWINELNNSEDFKSEIRNTVQIFQTASSLEEIISKINEKEIAARTLFSGTDLKLYYEHLAVAKYSAKFWYPVSQGGLNGASYIEFGDEDIIQAIDWWKVLACDCIGGIAGGPVGYAAASAISVIMQS